MSSEGIIGIVTTIATVLIAAVSLATLFYRMSSGMKKDLERQMREMKEDLERQIDGTQKRIDGLALSHKTLSDRVGKLSDRVDKLSDKVSQIIAILGNIGFVVKESEMSYKGGEGTTPAAKPKGKGATGSK